MELKPVHIIEGINNKKRISTTRAKTDVRVNVPLLQPAEEIMARYSTDGKRYHKRHRISPHQQPGYESQPENHCWSIQSWKASHFSHGATHFCHYCYFDEW